MRSRKGTDVFTHNHMEDMRRALEAMHAIAVSHIELPQFGTQALIDALIKPAHLAKLKECENLVGPVQHHSDVHVILENGDVTLNFPRVARLVPAYVQKAIAGPDDPFWRDLYTWYNARCKVGTEFAQAWAAFYQLNQHCRSVPVMKLYFNGVTALMQGCDGLKKRVEDTREVVVPGNMPTIHPELRAAGIRATQLIARVSLFDGAAEQVAQVTPALAANTKLVPTVLGRKDYMW